MNDDPHPLDPGDPARPIDPTAPLQVPWRRLDLRMLLVHPINETIGFLPVILIAVFAGGFSAASAVQYIAVVIPILMGVQRFLVTRYRITADQIDLRTGLISLRTTTVRIERIRTVDLSRPPIHRILDLAKVEIATAGNESVSLDSLRRVDAERLRDALLVRRTQVDGDQATAMESTPAVYPQTTLLRLDPRWARYALATAQGPVIIAIGFVVLNRYFDDILGTIVAAADLEHRLQALPLWLVVLASGAITVVVWIAVSVGSYFLKYGALHLTRDSANNTLRIRRGLVTRAEVSLDEARVRGVEIGEPWTLRAVGAARLNALVTATAATSGDSAVLVPPAPRDIVGGVADAVLADPTSLAAPLRQHGPIALRRLVLRMMRRGLVAAMVLGMAGWLAGLPDIWSISVGIAAFLVSPFVGWGAYRRLGHARTATHIVFRSGLLLGRTVVLQTDGVIGWRFTQSFFQRWAGVMDVHVGTAAGRESYATEEVPVSVGTLFAVETDPELFAQFLDGPAALRSSV